MSWIRGPFYIKFLLIFFINNSLINNSENLIYLFFKINHIAFKIPIALSSILHFQSSSLRSLASTVPDLDITANTYCESGENYIPVIKSEKLNTWITYSSYDDNFLIYFFLLII